MKLVPMQLPPLGAPPPLGLWGSELLWRYPPAPPSPLADLKPQLPAQLSTDPRLWGREDVSVFLRWCEREFDLPNFDMELFQMNGKALCLLTKNDLAERIPGAGDVLHNVLQMFIRDTQIYHRHLPSSPITPTSRFPLSPHSHPATPNWSALAPPDSPFHPAHLQHFMQTNSVTLSPAPSTDSQTNSPPRQQDNNQVQTVFPKIENSSSSNQSDSDEDSCYTDAAKNFQQGSQTSPPLTPITKEPPQMTLPQQINIANNWSNNQNDKLQNSPATPLTPGGAFMPVKREFFPETGEPNTNGRLLWDFLQKLLNDPAQRYSHYIAWKCRDTGVFKIVDPAGLAKLWGMQKNHLSMNYDKMSRALRYYYRVNILRKVQGERHCYQFLKNPSELKNIKNISLLRQNAAQSPAVVSNQNQASQLQQQQQQQQQLQQQQIQQIQHQQQHHQLQPPPNSPMMTPNGLHQLSQQFTFPPQPNHNSSSKLLTSNGFKVEIKSEGHDDMPTDLSVSRDRRYISNNTSDYPLIRNSNGLTTISLVQQQQQPEIGSQNQESNMDGRDGQLPGDLRTHE